MPQDEGQAQSKASREKLSLKSRAAPAGCIPTQPQQFVEDFGNIQQQEDANPCSRLLGKAAAGASQPPLSPEMGFVSSAQRPRACSARGPGQSLLPGNSAWGHLWLSFPAGTATGTPDALPKVPVLSLRLPRTGSRSQITPRVLFLGNSRGFGDKGR